MTVFDELMAIRDLAPPTEVRQCLGQDPVLPTRYPLGECAADVMLAIGVAINDLWELRSGERQDLSVRVDHAAAALRSYQYLEVDNKGVNDAFATQQGRQKISSPHPTRDGRYFLPHMGLPHLAERILDILKCDYELESVQRALLGWDALELEDAVAAAGGCGAMVRSAEEWAAHPHGQALAARPVIEIEKIGDAPPQAFPAAGDRPLSGIRALDLTRILAGPTCARTLAEHGADVLMVTAEHLPQTPFFVMDTSHGKRTCYLDLQKAGECDQLLSLVDECDIFSQGYRPGVMDRLGFSPEALAERRPGVVYVSMNCYGYDGPFRERAGWEQLAQTVTGIAHEHGGEKPHLLPAAACDYTTGYLAAFGTLLALRKRAEEGGSWHVRASLCQSGMMLQRQHRVAFEKDAQPGYLDEVMQQTQTPYGPMRHLGPILNMPITPPRWNLPSVPLGSHKAKW